MRPEREGGGVAAGLTGGGGGVGGRPSLWHTPTPYLFLGFALMMGLIAVALLVLICSRRKPSSSSSSPSRRGAGAAASGADGDAACSLVPLDREPKVVVIMAGDRAPSFLASAKPLAASVVVHANGGPAGDDGAV